MNDKNDMNNVLDAVLNSDEKQRDELAKTLIQSLSPEQKDFLDNALNDGETAKQLLSSPEAEMLFRLLSGKGED